MAWHRIHDHHQNLDYHYPKSSRDSTPAPVHASSLSAEGCLCGAHRSTGPWQRRAALPLLHAAALPVPGRLAAQWRATSPGRALETAARKRNLREMSDKKELHSTDAGKGNQEDFTWCVCLLLQGLDAAINNNLLVQSCLHGRFLVSRTVVKFCSPYPQLFFLV